MNLEAYCACTFVNKFRSLPKADRCQIIPVSFLDYALRPRQKSEQGKLTHDVVLQKSPFSSVNPRGWNLSESMPVLPFFSQVTAIQEAI